ncbi:MAG: hypothetical protein JWR24_3428 [Actinoallomurus sp.]|nr:hypothetical protein [Actinoallomurus sp.]
MPGDSFGGLSWSPDGRHIVLGSVSAPQQLLIFDAAHPRFATASRLSARHGCGYSAPAWTNAGIIAAERCGEDSHPPPHRLVRLSPSGAVDGSWPLPDCVDGFWTRTDASHTNVLVQADVGYGDDRCGSSRFSRVAALGEGGLRTIIDQPGEPTTITSGW